MIALKYFFFWVHSTVNLKNLNYNPFLFWIFIHLLRWKNKSDCYFSYLSNLWKTLANIDFLTESLFVRGPWLVLKIFLHFQSALQLHQSFCEMHFIGPCVTVLGSARFGPQTAHYKKRWTHWFWNSKIRIYSNDWRRPIDGSRQQRSYESGEVIR
jgi:hypothetical protein